MRRSLISSVIRYSNCLWSIGAQQFIARNSEFGLDSIFPFVNYTQALRETMCASLHEETLSGSGGNYIPTNVSRYYVENLWKIV
jgi:hypothetical protein